MAKQLSVFLQNKPGKLADITAALAKENVDIRALSIADTTDFGVLRMLVTNIEKAKKVLAEQNCIVSSTDVTVVAVPDEPGGLAKVLRLMAENGIDIEYMYSLIGRDAKCAYMVFRVENEELFQNLAREKGFEIVDGEALGIQ